ncbi:MAG: hypothetical protein AAF694_01135 [Bacteroidota bacterium]
MSGNSDSVKDTSRFILFGVGILILVAMVYFAYRYFQEKEENDQNLIKIEQLNQEVLSLEEKILNFEVELDNRNMQFVEKERELGEKDEQIEDLLNRLDEAKALGRSQLGKINQLQERLEQMQRFVDSYKSQIATLETRNLELETQVADLSANNEALEQSFSELQTNNFQTEERLEETLRIASVLKTGNFSISNIKKNGKEQEKLPFRRGAFHELKVCFEVMENLVAASGPREVFLVLTNPDGTPNVNFDSGNSGTFQFEGEERTYSSAKTVDYSRFSQEVCIPYTPSKVDEKRHAKGMYYLSLFSEGNLIGQSSFEVK